MYLYLKIFKSIVSLNSKNKLLSFFTKESYKFFQFFSNYNEYRY